MEQHLTQRGASLFWIDTLCVPVQRTLKQRALRQLHETYTNASSVVVLDSELLGKGISPHMLGSADVTFDTNLTSEQIPARAIQLDDGLKQTDGGLMVPLSGFRVQALQLPVGAQIRGADCMKTYFFFFDIKSRAWYSALYAQYSDDPAWEDLCNTPTARPTKLSIVLSADIPDGTHCTAALVGVYGAGDVGEVLYPEFRCLLTLFRASSLPSSSFGSGSNIDTAPPIGDELPTTKKLCEEILSDMWDNEDALEDKLRMEVKIERL